MLQFVTLLRLGVNFSSSAPYAISTRMKNERRRGVQSVEVAGRLLSVLSANPRALSLRDLSAAAGMPASKAHRYLVSLTNAGLVAQASSTGLYDLGPAALSVGLAALGRLNPYRIASEHLAQLRDELEETFLLAVWNGDGAVIVGWEESPKPVHVNTRVGSVLSLLNSATGRAFAAFLPTKIVEAIVAKEWTKGVNVTQDGKPVSREDFPAVLADIRARGLCRIRGDNLPSIDALSVPVFGHDGRICLVFTSLGPSRSFDSRWNGDVANALLKHGKLCSARLGFTG